METVRRLGAYSRYLAKLELKGVLVVSSEDIGKNTGVCSSQVRKDLAYFGDLGVKGVGYNVKDLKSYTLRILGLDRKWRLVVVGAGKLGCALATYRGFTERGFVTVGIFDDDRSKFGARVGHLTVSPVNALGDIVEKHGVLIGVIAVPGDSAQEVADLMVQNGLQAILNFAPVSINVPPDIIVPDVGLVSLLEAVTFNFTHGMPGLARRELVTG